MGCPDSSYWDDRYHATSVQTSEHFLKCMSYIDLNMIRAGVVSDPSEWPFGGYHEIRKAKKRYRLIDHDAILKLSGYSDFSKVLNYIDRENERCLKNKRSDYKIDWSKDIAIGDEVFVERFKSELALIGSKREIKNANGQFELKEPKAKYNQSAVPKDNLIPIIG